MDLVGKKIVLGLIGGVVCYKVVMLVCELGCVGVMVYVVMIEVVMYFMIVVIM